MIRREFIAAASITLPIAGCLGGGADPGGGRDDDSVPDLTGFSVSDHVVTPDAERNSDMDAWGLFIANSDAADAYFESATSDDADAVRDFVEETDFEAGDRLLYVGAYAPQTCYELVLDGNPRVPDNGIPLVKTLVDRTADDDEPCGDAMTHVELLVRLSFDLDAAPTDVVAVEIAGHRDDPEELMIEAER